MPLSLLPPMILIRSIIIHFHGNAFVEGAFVEGALVMQPLRQPFVSQLQLLLVLAAPVLLFKCLAKQGLRFITLP